MLESMAGKLRSSSQVTVEARPGPQLVPARLSYPKIYRFDCDDFLVAQQLYIPLRFFFLLLSFFLSVHGLWYAGLQGLLGAVVSPEGPGEPPNQIKIENPNQTKPHQIQPNQTKTNQTKLKPTKPN